MNINSQKHIRRDKHDNSNLTGIYQHKIQNRMENSGKIQKKKTTIAQILINIKTLSWEFSVYVSFLYEIG